MAGVTYLGCRHSPDLEVVRSHEDVGDTLTAVPHDPLVKVLGLGVGDTVLESGIDQPVYALDLVVLGKHGDVVLERVGDPKALVAHVGDALVGVPVILAGQCLVDAVVEVLVVREDDVTADVVELCGFKPLVSRTGLPSKDGTGGYGNWRLTKPSGVTSVEARPPAFSLESIISHEGPF